MARGKEISGGWIIFDFNDMLVSLRRPGTGEVRLLTIEDFHEFC
jgi:hypothetical protein